MPNRLLEIVFPAEQKGQVEAILEAESVMSAHYDSVSDQLIEARVLVSSGSTEDVVDKLDKALSFHPSYRMVILRVEAVLPRPPEEAEKPKEAESAGTSDSATTGSPSSQASTTGTTGDKKEETKKPSSPRVSREELYNSVAPATRLNAVFVTTVLLSSIVAAVGLYRNDVAIIIGAMVIAPLLGPNIALALGTTLGDRSLCSRALHCGLTGFVLALLFATLVGAAFPLVDERRLEVMTQFSSRTIPGVGDFLLALAAGISGALAFTTGVSASLIGVMVAVALLPPLIVVGVLLGSGIRLEIESIPHEHFLRALGATCLLLTNIICVNLAGVATFLVQGVRPRGWWEEHQAKRSTRLALLVWLTLLGALAILIGFFLPNWQPGKG